jgi:hypothetical protein
MGDVTKKTSDDKGDDETSNDKGDDEDVVYIVLTIHCGLNGTIVAWVYFGRDDDQKNND